MKNFELPKDVSCIISKLTENGYRADIVGGSVRDILLGKTPSDYDITTDATPEEMRGVFKDCRTVDTGIKHGTLTVIINNAPYEVTTYRVDGEYTDSRHPDTVEFTDKLYEDLARRDFTVNAMCYSEKYGFTDMFSGREDLRFGIIRAVGDPEKRFTEDALRILRALRFASSLDFVIEEKTSRALIRKKELLLRVSTERVYVEWKKLIGGAGARRIIEEYIPVISVVLKGLSRVFEIPSPEFDNADASIRELYLYAIANRENPLRAFSQDMTALKSDNKHRRYGEGVLKALAIPTDTEKDIKNLLIKTDREIAEGVIRLKILLGKSDENTLRLLKKIIEEGFPCQISELEIDGNDLLGLGYSGAEIGRLLKEALQSVADGETENKKEKLLALVSKNG